MFEQRLTKQVGWSIQRVDQLLDEMTYRLLFLALVASCALACEDALPETPGARAPDEPFQQELEQTEVFLRDEWRISPLAVFELEALVFGRDEARVEAYQPYETTQEIPSYVYPKAEDGKVIKETPDPTCQDHGCDATRYACMYKWRKDLSDPEEPTSYPPGSIGDIMGDDEVYERAE